MGRSKNSNQANSAKLETLPADLRKIADRCIARKYPEEVEPEVLSPKQFTGSTSTSMQPRLYGLGTQQALLQQAPLQYRSFADFANNLQRLRGN